MLPNYCYLTVPMLKSFDPIKKTAIANQDIVLLDRIIGQAKKEVDLTEAARIQEFWIKKAKEEKMILLQFSGFGYEKYADSGDMRYRAGNNTFIETDKPYYCKIIHSYTGEYLAEAIFEVFDLSDNPSVITLKTLAEKWGAKLKKS
jgi:hypothetical protein